MDITALMPIIFNIVLVVLGISSLIVVHEIGHFLAARLCGVRCERFYIGFDVGGRRFLRFQWGETEFGLGVIPLGGYVQMEADSFSSKSVARRSVIISAGIVMNFLFAIFCASIAYMIEARGFTESIFLGTSKTLEFSHAIFGFLGGLCDGSVSPKMLGGPIMIVQAAYTFAGQGLDAYLFFLCMISVNLAIFNLLPIPVLDGGHLLYLLYEYVFRRQPSEFVQTIACYSGLFFLVSLTLWTVVLDLMRLMA